MYASCILLRVRFVLELKVGFGIPTIKVCNDVVIGLACSRATILNIDGILALVFYCVSILVCITQNLISRMILPRTRYTVTMSGHAKSI